MFALSRILVATDFGPPSAAAIDYAIGLASSLGARVIIFHAFEIPVIGVPDGTFVSTPEMVSRIEAASERALESTAHAHAGRAADAGDVPLDTLLREGRPSEAIRAAAQEIGADLIVIGTHGRQGFARALLGSVAEKVVRIATVPVLVVHMPALHGDRTPSVRTPSAGSVASRSFG